MAMAGGVRSATARVRSPLAAAAASGWRRFLCDGSKHDETPKGGRVQGKEEAPGALMDDDLLTRKVREIIKSEAEGIFQAKGLQLVFEKGVEKQTRCFEKRIEDQSSYFRAKLSNIQKHQESFKSETRASVDKIKNECSTRANVADEKIKDLNDDYMDIKKSSDVTVERTQIVMVLVIGALGVVVMGVGVIILFH